MERALELEPVDVEAQFMAGMQCLVYRVRRRIKISNADGAGPGPPGYCAGKMHEVLEFLCIHFPDYIRIEFFIFR